MTPLPDVLGSKILAFTPEVSHAQVSKGFAIWNKKLIEKEWQEIIKNPLLAKYIEGIQEEPPHNFKVLFERLRKVFCTYTGRPDDKYFTEVFKGSYKKECFENAQHRAQDAEDFNLRKAWHGEGGGLYCHFSLFGTEDWSPQEIRNYLDAPANQAIINRVASIHLNARGINAIPQEVVKCRETRSLHASHNNIRAFPEVLLQMENLQKVDLTENPITVFSEEMYNYCFTLENWLGRPFDEEELGDYYIGFFDPSPTTYDNGYIRFSKEHIKEIPFAMWLRERLRIGNLVPMIWGKREERFTSFDLPCILRYPFCLAAFISALIIGIPTWLLNQFLSLILVPIVTKVRELLGFGRMTRLD